MASKLAALSKALISGDEPAPVNTDAETLREKETVTDDPKADQNIDDSNVSYEYGVAVARAMMEVIWLVCFVWAFSSSIIGTLSVYVLSDFDSHSLTPTVSIVANVLSGLIKLPHAKLMSLIYTTWYLWDSYFYWFPVVVYGPSVTDETYIGNIYGAITVQTSYAVSKPTRGAINRAYGDTQKLMLIAATCLYSITMWKDINVKKIEQLKGFVW